jgi:hypothetical protein
MIILIQTMSVFAQKPYECKLKSKYDGKYKKGVITRTLERSEKPSFLIIQISISPENFNKEYLLAVAVRIRDKYCKEQRIQVGIFDEHTAAKTGEYLFSLDSMNIPLRGYYVLNRETNEEYITFATERGKPRDEVRINL